MKRRMIRILAVGGVLSVWCAVVSCLCVCLLAPPSKRGSARHGPAVWAAPARGLRVNAVRVSPIEEVAQPDTAVEDIAADNFVSVDFQLSGYCRAGSRFSGMYGGGFASSKNMPLSNNAAFAAMEGLQLVAQPKVVTQFGEVKGMRVCLVNETGLRLEFPASDSRLDIVQQAQDESGVWRTIEQLPRSWCGHSYHQVFLPTGEFWGFAAARYRGSMPTRLRFAMPWQKGWIYSNEFDGSVNPEQFVIANEYQATYVMDSYGK